MRKPTSFLETKLTDLQQAQLADWLLSGVKYWEAIPLIEKEFGLKLSSTSAFRPFWEHVCVPQLIYRRQQSRATADAVGEEAKKYPGRFDEATIAALKQKAFDLSVSPNSNPKDVKAIFTLVLKSQDQATDAERLRLERDKFEFDAAKAAMAKLPTLRSIVASKLSESEKVDQVRRALFGVLPA